MAVKPRIMMISTHGYVAAEPEFGLPDTGGQVVYVIELSKCLARMGYSVDIYTRRFADQPQIDKVSERVRVIRARCGGKDFIAKEHLWEFIPEWVTNVANYVRSKGLRYEFINSHYWDAGLAGQALANHLEIPHLHTPHSIGSWKRDNMNETPADAERKYNFTKRIREERMVYQECDAIIATTPQQRDILTNPEGEYDTRRNKIFTIPPGYDDTRFFPVSKASREALKRDAGLEGSIILAVGRMAHNKGYDLLLRAMPVVFSRIEDARLLLAVGSTTPSTREKEQIAELKDLARELAIADRVIFGDYIEDNDLPNYYRMADVFALSSRYEPFGMTAVEAMACGTPTMITTEGGLWEQVIWGLEALCANPFDPESFGHGIHFILANPRVATQLAKRGSEKARGRFTWTGIAQQLLNATHNLAPRGKRGLAGVDDPTQDVSDTTLTDVQLTR